MSIGKLTLSYIDDTIKELEQTGKLSYPEIFQIKEGDLQISVKAFSVDKIGLQVDYIHIVKEVMKSRPGVKELMERQAEYIEKHISYLLEKFKIVELDSLNQRTQLRSYPPYDTEDGKYFYEILLENGDEIFFQRFNYSYESKRYEKVISEFTREMFSRLINDLVAALNLEKL
ncbi:MAG: hypothetical protein Kow00108_03080 [Calditrichia bacterium]